MQHSARKPQYCIMHSNLGQMGDFMEAILTHTHIKTYKGPLGDEGTLTTLISRICKCMPMSNLSIWCLLNICNLLYVGYISTRLKRKSTLYLLLKTSFVHEAWLRTNGKRCKRKWEVILLEEMKCVCRQFPNMGIGQEWQKQSELTA